MNNNGAKEKFDIYEAVTNRIIAELEKGIIPWSKPWFGTRGGAIKHHNGEPYSLLNQFLLGKAGEWLTYKQAQKEGGYVKKGAKSRMVVFWKIYVKPLKDENGEPKKDKDGKPIMQTIPVLKYDNVFHIDDCENIQPKYPDAAHEIPPQIDRAEDIFKDYIRREHIKFEQTASDEAYYSPARDLIHLPLLEQFKNSAEYYGTAFHEATHSTGAANRLNRLAKARFGDTEYSKEELVAEIGSAGILNLLGIETGASFKNTTAYIQSWLNALRDDKKLIVSAAGKAEKAINMIMNIKDKEQEAEASAAAA